MDLAARRMKKIRSEIYKPKKKRKNIHSKKGQDIKQARTILKNIKVKGK